MLVVEFNGIEDKCLEFANLNFEPIKTSSVGYKIPYDQ